MRLWERERSCPTVLLEQKPTGPEEESEDEGVWQMSQCGSLFITYTGRLVGQCLITFADTFSWCLKSSCVKGPQEPVVAFCLGEIREHEREHAQRQEMKMDKMDLINLGSTRIEAKDEQCCTQISKNRAKSDASARTEPKFVLKSELTQ